MVDEQEQRHAVVYCTIRLQLVFSFGQATFRHVLRQHKDAVWTTRCVRAPSFSRPPPTPFCHYAAAGLWRVTLLRASCACTLPPACALAHITLLSMHTTCLSSPRRRTLPNGLTTTFPRLHTTPFADDV